MGPVAVTHPSLPRAPLRRPHLLLTVASQFPTASSSFPAAHSSLPLAAASQVPQPRPLLRLSVKAWTMLPLRRRSSSPPASCACCAPAPRRTSLTHSTPTSNSAGSLRGLQLQPTQAAAVAERTGTETAGGGAQTQEFAASCDQPDYRHHRHQRREGEREGTLAANACRILDWETAVFK